MEKHNSFCISDLGFYIITDCFSPVFMVEGVLHSLFLTLPKEISSNLKIIIKINCTFNYNDKINKLYNNLLDKFNSCFNNIVIENIVSSNKLICDASFVIDNIILKSTYKFLFICHNDIFLHDLNWFYIYDISISKKNAMIVVPRKLKEKEIDSSLMLIDVESLKYFIIENKIGFEKNGEYDVGGYLKHFLLNKNNDYVVFLDEEFNYDFLNHIGGISTHLKYLCTYFKEDELFEESDRNICCNYENILENVIQVKRKIENYVKILNLFRIIHNNLPAELLYKVFCNIHHIYDIIYFKKSFLEVIKLLENVFNIKINSEEIFYEWKIENNFSSTCECVKNNNTKIIEVYDYKMKNKQEIRQCDWYFNHIVVLSDGRVTTCCADWSGENTMGNIYDQDILDIWNGVNFVNFRKRNNEFGSCGASDKCKECSLFTNKPIVKKDDLKYIAPVKAPFPHTLQIEAISACNADCKECNFSRGSEVKNLRSKAVLEFDEFKKIIDSVYLYVDYVRFYNYGEHFLHKDAFRMIEYVKEKRENIFIYTSTNFWNFNDDKIRKLINSGIDRVVVSLHGGSQEASQGYMPTVNFNEVINSMRRFVEIRNEMGLTKPQIGWKSVLFPWNDSDEDMNKMRQLAKEIQVDRYGWELSGTNSVSSRFSGNSEDYKTLVKNDEIFGW